MWAAMSLPEPFRGEVWDIDFPDFGVHPAVVLRQRAQHPPRPCRGDTGDRHTGTGADPRDPLTPDAGLTRYDESHADITALQPVARSQFLERRGLLVGTEIERLATQLSTYLGL